MSNQYTVSHITVYYNFTHKYLSAVAKTHKLICFSLEILYFPKYFNIIRYYMESKLEDFIAMIEYGHILFVIHVNVEQSVHYHHH